MNHPRKVDKMIETYPLTSAYLALALFVALMLELIR